MFERPEGPDAERIIALINRLDDRASAEEGIDAIIAELPIDRLALGYLCTQRAMRALGVTTVGEIRDQMLSFTRLASVYYEAFTMGVWWSKDEDMLGGSGS